MFVIPTLLPVIRLHRQDPPPDSASFPTIDDPRVPRTPPNEIDTALLIPDPGHVLRRRRSHLKRWIEDQQYHAHVGPDDDDFFSSPDSPVERVGTPCNPYLAYPHLSASSFHRRTTNEVGSLHNYVVVDDVADDDAPADEDRFFVDSDGAEVRVI